MSPQQAAHLRMLEALPRRTHEWKPVQGNWGIRRQPKATDVLREKLQQAHAEGMTRTQMIKTFRISCGTVVKLLGRVMGSKHPRPRSRR